MPRKRSYKPRRNFKKRYNRRNGGKGGSLGFRPSSKKLPIVIPDKFTNICTYSANRSINPGAGAIAQHVWRANSIYDPDYTGAGVTAKGYDTFMASGEDATTGMYEKATVIGSRFVVEMINTDASNPVRVGLYTSETATGHATEFIALNDKDVQTKFLGPLGSGSERCVLKSNWSFKKTFGKKADISDDNYATIWAGNPSKPVFFHTFASNEFLGADTGVVYQTVRIEYICVWTSPISVDMA